MKKSKIEIGQCYEYLGHIWMIAGGPLKSKNGKKYYNIRETLTNEYSTMSELSLLSLRRPFDNNG